MFLNILQFAANNFELVPDTKTLASSYLFYFIHYFRSQFVLTHLTWHLQLHQFHPNKGWTPFASKNYHYAYDSFITTIELHLKVWYIISKYII